MKKGRELTADFLAAQRTDEAGGARHELAAPLQEQRITETPYRNAALLQGLLQTLKGTPAGWRSAVASRCRSSASRAGWWRTGNSVPPRCRWNCRRCS